MSGSQDDGGGSSEASRTRGMFTKKDQKWLDGKNVISKDQQRRCKHRFAHTMQDIQSLVENDLEGVSNLDEIGALFEKADEVTGQTPTEAAEALIALAFCITNHQLDYAEIAEQVVLHPRNSGDNPSSDDRPTMGGPLNFNQPVEDVLAFRNALSRGIKKGKSRYDDVPETVLIDSNTKLYKEPTVDRLKPPELDKGVTNEDAKDATAKAIDADGPWGSSKPKTIREAAAYMKREIEGNITIELSHRRHQSDSDITRHDIEI